MDRGAREGRCHGVKEVETGAVHTWAASGPSQKPMERRGTEHPHNLGGACLADPLVSDVWPPDCETIHFYCFQPAGMGPFCCNSLGNEHGTVLAPSLPASASCFLLRISPELWVPLVPPSQRPYSSNQLPDPLHLQLARPPDSFSSTAHGGAPACHLDSLPHPHPGPGPRPLFSPLFQDEASRRSRHVWPFPHPIHWWTTGIQLLCPLLQNSSQASPRWCPGYKSCGCLSRPPWILLSNLLEMLFRFEQNSCGFLPTSQSAGFCFCFCKL